MITFFLNHVNCLAIIALGFWLGYLFIWGLVNLNVSTTGFVTLATFIFTGPAIEFVGNMNCAHGTAFYILSGVLGGIIYLVLITIFKNRLPNRNNDQPTRISKLTPVFPWLYW